MFRTSGGRAARFMVASIIPIAGLAFTSVAHAVSITLADLPATVTVGQPLTLNATVSGATTGYVTFFDNTKQIGTKVTLTKTGTSTSNAKITVAAVSPVGTHNFKATFGTYSNTKTTIAKYATTAALSTTVAANGSTRAGQAITLSATVASAQAGVTPTGTVTFYDGASPIGNATLAGGKASLVTSLTLPGARTIKVDYSSDGNNMASSASTAVQLNGRDYFVGTGANALNSNPGTETQPWRDLYKLDTVYLKAANESFRLQCGGEWRETLKLSTSNALNSTVPVTVSGWGACSSSNRPTLNAAVQLVPTRWVSPDSTATVPIYTYQFAPGELPADVSQLFIRGANTITPLQVARYPNTGFAPIAVDSSVIEVVKESGKEKYSAYLTTNEADHLNINANSTADLVGARVHVRVSDYRFADRTIGSYTATSRRSADDLRTINEGLLTFSWDPADEEQYTTDLARRERAKWTDVIRQGFGYVLTGKRWMLDTAGEWSYDPATRTLSLWAPNGVNPNTLVIEAAVREHGVSATNVKVDLNDVAVKFATQEGIAIDGGPGSRINNVDVAYSGRNGIGIDMNQRGSVLSASTSLLNSRISFSRGSGFITGWSVPGQVVEGNTVTETGTFQEPHRADCAICVGAGSDAPVTVRNNLVQGASYHGISFSNNSSSAGNSQITSNVVENVCLRLDDCGGIYTYNANRNPDVQGADVFGNVVRGVKGSLQGSPATRLVGAVGIYLDNDTANVNMDDNVVSDAETGVVLHDASYITMQRNSLMGFRRSGLYVLDDSRMAVGIFVRNNRFVAGGTYALTQRGADAPEIQRLASVVTLSSEWNRNKDKSDLPPDYAPQDMSSYMFWGNSYASLYGPVVFELNDHFTTGHFKVGAAHWKNTWYANDGPFSDTLKPLLSPFRATLTGSSVVTNGDMSQTGTDPVWGTYPVGWDATNSTISLSGPECGANASPCAQRVTDPDDSRSRSGSPSSPFNMVEGQTYVLKMRVRTPAGPSAFYPIVGLHCEGLYGADAGYNGSAFTPGADWVEFQAPFKAGGLARCASSQTRLSLAVAPAVPGLPELVPMYWDDVSITPASVQIGTGADDYRVLVNGTSNTATVQCPDAVGSARCSQYVDVNRQPVSFPLTLPANSAMTVVWKGSTFYNATAQ